MKKSKDFLKAIKVAKKYDIKIVWTRNPAKDKDENCTGHWEKGKTIYIHSKKGTAYTILHEIGHSIAGYMCCHEHCEYTAHGVALGLAKSHNIKLTKKQADMIDNYAGRTNHKCCGAIMQHKLADAYAKNKPINKIAKDYGVTIKLAKEIIQENEKEKNNNR